MATFTRPNGESVDVPPGSKLRARPAFSWEIGGQSGSTLFKPQLLVTEEIAAVGSALILLKKSLDLAPALWLPACFEHAIHGQPDWLSGDGRHRLEFRQFPEVLCCCCEGEFVLDATWPS